MSLIESIPPTLKTYNTSLIPSASPSTSSSLDSTILRDPLNFIKLYETKLKVIYTLNLTLLDKLSHSSYSLLIINLNLKLVDFYKTNFKDLKNMLYLQLNSDTDSDGLMNHCFSNFLTNEFNSNFEGLLKEITDTYIDLFQISYFYKLNEFPMIYNELLKIMDITKYNRYSHSHNSTSTSANFEKVIDKINDIEFKILMQSNSLNLFKNLNGIYNASEINNQNLINFKKTLQISYKHQDEGQQQIDDEGYVSVKNDTDESHDDDDLEIVKSVEFQEFNLKRLHDLGYFNKTIF